jgi:hypothetical protein
MDTDHADFPRPTIARDRTVQLDVDVDDATRSRLETVERAMRSIFERLTLRRMERFTDETSVFEVSIHSVCGEADCGRLPERTLASIEQQNDNRWRQAFESMIYVDRPPGDGRRRSSSAALSLLTEDTLPPERMLTVSTDAIRISDEDPTQIELALSETETLSLQLAANPRVPCEQFPVAHLAWHSAHGREVIESLGSAFTDPPPATLTFEPCDRQRTLGSRSSGVGTLIPERLVTRLESTPRFPSATAVDPLEAVLGEGPFRTEEKLAIVALCAGVVDAIQLRYGTAVPRVVSELARITRSELVHVPQSGSAILTRKPVPDELAAFADAFPDKQYLTVDDRRAIELYLGHPDYAVPVPTMANEHRVVEKLAMLSARDSLSKRDAFYFAVSPWTPPPNEGAIRTDVERGRAFVSDLEAFDDRYSLSLATDPLGTIRERVYGSSAYPLEF